MYLHRTLRETEEDICPSGLSARQVYTPASLSVTFSSIKTPKAVSSVLILTPFYNVNKACLVNNESIA